MFFDNNPFEAVRKREDLNGLQKIRELLALSMYVLEITGLAALFECFIKIDFQSLHNHSSVFSMIKEDFLLSMQFVFKEQPNIVKMLFLTAVSRFFVMGITMVGLPYIVRTILGLDAKYYAVSIIQQRTPNHLIGKVMAYTSVITLCVQPIGQIIYGILYNPGSVFYLELCSALKASPQI